MTPEQVKDSLEMAKYQLKLASGYLEQALVRIQALEAEYGETSIQM